MLAMIFSFFGSLFGRFLSYSVVWGIALKVMIYGFCLLILPVVILKGWGLVQDVVLSYAFSHLSQGGFTAQVLTFSGWGAWIANELRLPECFSLFMSALGLRFTLHLIKAV